MEISDYLRILRRHWVGVLLLAIVTTSAAGVASALQSKVYAADASGFVSVGNSKSAAEASIGDVLAKSRATSYVDLAKSRAVAQDVAKDLGLKASPSSLIGRIKVNQPIDTVLIKITAHGTTPAAAQELADAWAASLADAVATLEASSDDGAAVKLVPIESAELPSTPISPNIRRNVALGLILGLMLGAAYAMLRSQLDRRLTSASLVEKDFRVTVAASIPETDTLKRDAGGMDGHIMAGRATGNMSVAKEAFLKLRTNLQFMDVDQPPRVIVVTSPLPGDGKSTIAANLAAAVSVTGQRVVLIDGDLRRPVVAGSFGVVEGLGLTDLVIGRASVQDVLQEVNDLPNLRIIAAGVIPPNPSELLGSNVMAKILQDLATTYLVIIDAPPLLPVTDAAVLSARADGALVVISSGKTLDSQLDDALGLLNQVNGRILGVVLNKVARRDSGAGTYYGDYQQPARKAAKPSKTPKKTAKRASRT